MERRRLAREKLLETGGLTTRGGGRPRSLLDRGISRLLSQISSQHGRKQLRGISSAAFTPLSRFPVKRLNGARLSSRQRERRSFLASSFRGSFHSMRRSVKDHREKEEKDEGKKRKKKGKERRREREREKIEREGR